MGITIDKARKVLKSYQDNNYNASKALQSVGYTEQTADKASKIIINAAIKKVARDELKNIETSVNPMSSLLGIVGIERDDLLKEYTKILKQDKDLSTKLKSMLPLLKELGLTWEQEQTNVKVPILNITTRGTEVETTKLNEKLTQ